MKARPALAALLKAYVVLVLLFLFAPLGASLVFSFNSDRFPTLPLGSFTLEWYRAVLSDDLVRESLAHTARVSVLSATLSTLLGFAAASSERSTWLRRSRASAIANGVQITVWAITIATHEPARPRRER